jgi:hypothetical protein
MLSVRSTLLRDEVLWDCTHDISRKTSLIPVQKLNGVRAAAITILPGIARSIKPRNYIGAVFSLDLPI